MGDWTDTLIKRDNGDSAGFNGSDQPHEDRIENRDLSTLKKAELVKLAEDRGVKGVNDSMTNDELRDAIRAS